MKTLRKALSSLWVLSLTISAISCGQQSTENTSPADVQIAEATNETIAEADTQTTESVNSTTLEADIQTTESTTEAFAEFEVRSEDLHDGIWDTVITKTKNGSNVSPQLSWESVEGAQSYIIYMVDTSASNWMHWKSGNISETILAQGSAAENEYVGPYPPSGKHTYEIWVYALENPVENIPGKFDDVNGSFDDYKNQISENSKILAVAHLSGTYKHGD